MTLIQHLAELRRRLWYCIVVVFVVGLICLSFAPELFEWLRGPLAAIDRQHLIVLSPLELYVTYIKLAVVSALFFSAPWILYQVWMFVAPGLYAHEKRWIAPFVLLGTLFFVGGALFAFYIVLPFGFQYVVAAMPASIEAQFSVEVYYSLVVSLLLAFGCVFELPLLMWILSAAGVVNPALYGRIRRYWIVVAFIAAAVLTPTPDPFTQIMMAVPLLFFYEAGVIGGKILYKRHLERVAAASPAG